MNMLAKLFFLKKKGAIRNLFSKKSSAIITTIVVLFYGITFIPMLFNINKKGTPMTFEREQVLVFTILGAVLLLALTALLQSRKALFFVEDAHYMFTGPFSNKKILTYLAFDIFTAALLYAVISIFPIIVLSNNSVVPPSLIGLLLLVCLMIHYSIMSLSYILYIRQLIAGKKTKSHLIVALSLFGIIAAVAIYSYISSGSNITDGLNNFTNSSAFHFIPMFGWGKYAVISVLKGNLIGIVTGFGLLLVANVVLTIVLVNTKGQFFEQAMIDAENFTDYYKKVKGGQADEVQTGKSVRDVNMKFRKREGAIFSKNLLLAIKSRALFRPASLLVIAMYLAIAYFTGIKFPVFFGMTMFWLFTSAGTSSLLEDLKHHYIYLIPGNPLRKLFNAIAISYVKDAILGTLAVIVGGVLLKEGRKSILLYVLLAYTFLLLFNAGNVVCLRLLKASSNKMLETTIGLVVAILAMLPGIAAIVVIAILQGTGMPQISTIIIALGISNLIMSLVGLAVCAPMMNKTAIGAD